jgi:hypothetical protein
MYNQKILSKPLPIKAASKTVLPNRSRLASDLLRLARSRDNVHNNGYIMYVVLLLVLTVMGTTIALADRTTSGLAGQMRQSVLRDAELATENGLTRTITDMNSPANRYVWGVKTENWANPGDWAPSDTIRDKLYPHNSCKGVSYFPNNTSSFTVNGATEVFKRISQRQTNVSNFTEEWVKGFVFQVIGIIIKDENHQVISDITRKKTDGSSMYPKGPSYVEFRVRGVHNSLVNYDTNWDNSTNQTRMRIGWRDGWTRQQKEHDVSFEITREYKLAPFCCTTGFIDKQEASTTRSLGSAKPTCATTYNPDDYNLSNTSNISSSFVGNSDKEKMGWTIVGPSSTGVFRSSL